MELYRAWSVADELAGRRGVVIVWAAQREPPIVKNYARYLPAGTAPSAAPDPWARLIVDGLFTELEINKLSRTLPREWGALQRQVVHRIDPDWYPIPDGECYAVGERGPGGYLHVGALESGAEVIGSFQAGDAERFGVALRQQSRGLRTACRQLLHDLHAAQGTEVKAVRVQVDNAIRRLERLLEDFSRREARGSGSGT